MFTEKQINSFWAKVEKTDYCWNFKTIDSARRKHRYGSFGVWQGRKVKYRAHRVSFFLTNGYMPSQERMVCHTCDNPRCVRPDHLYDGTAKTNAEDRVTRDRSRKSGPKKPKKYETQICFLYCSKGHYKPGAVVVTKKGPECKVCHREERRLAYHKKKKLHKNFIF